MLNLKNWLPSITLAMFLTTSRSIARTALCFRRFHILHNHDAFLSRRLTPTVADLLTRHLPTFFRYQKRGSSSIPLIDSVQLGISQLTLNWPARFRSAPASSIFHYVWLRDNCQCAQCVHPTTRQKLHSSALIPLDIRPLEARVEANQLTIKWSRPLEHEISASREPHTSSYTLDWLRDQDYSDSHRVAQRKCAGSQQILWQASSLPTKDLWMSYESDFMKSEKSLHQLLVLLEKYGVAFLRDVPRNDGEVERVAERIGPIRETLYGRSWDVKSVPDAKNIAYTSLFLDLHMDLMYFESPPGLQFLHCLENTVKGGESLFLDIYQAVELLRQTDNKAYRTLTQVPVTFHYVNNGHRMRHRRPTIIDSSFNEPLQVFYAPPFQGPMDCSPDQIEEFYRAFKQLNSIIHDSKLLYKVRLQPGDCVVFANRRVLHGRTSFDSLTGSRHLKGTYVDIDVFRDRLAHLEWLYRK